MSDDEIDLSDSPALDEVFFENARLRLPNGKVSVMLSIDEDLAEWFRRQGGDLGANLNNALRDYAESHR